MRLSTFVAVLAWGSFFALFWLLALGKMDVGRAISLEVFCLAVAIVVALFRESATKMKGGGND